MKKYGLLSLMTLMLVGTYAFQVPVNVSLSAQGATEQVQWMTFEEAMEKSATEPRKIFVSVYTEWCSWCKHMEGTTYNNSEIARYLNDNYYPVKFDAEMEQDITFKEKVYSFVKDGKRGHHELAVEMMNGRWSFPTFVFLDEGFDVIQPLNGFKKPNEFEAILTYFAQNFYKKMPWSKFEHTYEQEAKGVGN